jgi:hypothetical protein
MWKDEFLKLMSGTTIDGGSIEKAQRLKDSHIPEYLYKFRGVNEYSLQNLESDTVWVCSATNYNDPYDCASTLNVPLLTARSSKLNFSDAGKHGGLDKHLTESELAQAQAAEDPMREIALALFRKEKTIKESDYEKLLEGINSALLNVGDDMIRSLNSISQQGMKVCSFSERNDSIVMWGHYAVSHTGFCLEYPIKSLAPGDPRRSSLFPVTYSPELFDATPYLLQSMETEGFNNLFGMMAGARKAPDWSYEEEWRLLLPMGESFHDQNYQMPTPTTIYLGTRISEQHEEKIREVGARRGIPVKKMKLSQREFKLVPEDEK